MVYYGILYDGTNSCLSFKNWLTRHDVNTKVCENDVTDFVGDNQREAFVAQSSE